MKRGLQKQPSDAPEPAADRALAAPGRWMVASRLRTGLVGGLFMAFGLFLIVVIPT
jgi:predicted lipid-binding transport protein (Tim44 family)